MDSSAPTDFVAEAARLFGGTVMDPRRFRPGISHKNGKLYVFSPTRIIVMAPWPEMRAWTKTRARPKWRPCRPFVRLGIEDPGDTYVHDRLKRWDAPWAREGVVDPNRFTEEGVSDAGLGLRDPPCPEDAITDDFDELCEEINLQEDRRQAREHEARRRFFGSIPSDTAALVKPFPERQWHLLSMFARCSGAGDLVASNPALAFALASNWVYHRPAVQRPLRAARSLLHRKQREIAGWLAFPESEVTVRVLRKLEPDACQTGLLLRLRDRMRDPATLRFLSHCPPMDAAGLLMFLRPETTAWVSPSLLEQARAAAQTLTCASHLADIIEMRHLLRDPRSARRLTSITQLRTLHDDLVERTNRAGLRPLGVPPLPPPPFPGTESLIPLTTEEDLLEEGYRQSNCVGAYASRVRRGRRYIYRLLSPERATVEIVLRKAGWKLGEIEAAQNQAVQPETGRLVQAWLQQHTCLQNKPPLSRRKPQLKPKE